MRHLRGLCYPASIWIPYRELHDTSPVRKLLLMGWTKEIVDDAREILYNFITTEIGEQIDSLQPVLNQQDVWETWNRSRPSRREWSKEQLPSCQRIEVEKLDKAPLEVGEEINEASFEEVDVHQDDAAAWTTDDVQDQEKLSKAANEYESLEQTTFPRLKVSGNTDYQHDHYQGKNDGARWD